ncbi:hypothetical protein AVEN_235450-1 [Araneus ventricosus]|uniref:Uncharacterized protein n=1 Tax=Araneus ventricosus TaxID=182803 RepID=A0A4Y2A3V3_ARAVE|nr:hypothetical protein AVEN_235450-1 [Araneus ventricosus]
MGYEGRFLSSGQPMYFLSYNLRIRTSTRFVFHSATGTTFGSLSNFADQPLLPHIPQCSCHLMKAAVVACLGPQCLINVFSNTFHQVRNFFALGH